MYAFMLLSIGGCCFFKQLTVGIALFARFTKMNKSNFSGNILGLQFCPVVLFYKIDAVVPT
jgi:hypothetical protein